MKTITQILVTIALVLSFIGEAKAELWGCFAQQGAKSVRTETMQLLGSSEDPKLTEDMPCGKGGTWHLLRKQEVHASAEMVRGIANILNVGNGNLAPTNTSGMTTRPWTTEDKARGFYQDWKRMSKAQQDALMEKWHMLTAQCSKVFPKARNSSFFDTELVMAAKLVFTPPQNGSVEEQARYLAWYVSLFKALKKAETGNDGPQDTCEVSNRGAGGLIQVIAATIFEHCDGMNVLIPSVGLECGMKEYASYALKDRLGGSLKAIAESYNMGFGNYTKRNGVPFESTRQYVERILRYQAWYLQHGLQSEPRD